MDISRLCKLMLLATATGLILAGCSTVNQMQRSALDKVTPYQIPVVQGNVVTTEQLGLLKEGMSHEQVEDILGTPLLSSPFAVNRWDYVFTLKERNKAIKESRITVFFDNDVVSKIESANVPTEAAFLASIKTKKIDEKSLPSLVANPEELAKFASKKDAEKEDKTKIYPQASYPPLSTINP